MREFYDRVAQLLAGDTCFAIATIVRVGGSSPRDAGAKMIVFQDGSVEGTLGGGKLEAQVVRDALDCLCRRSTTMKSYGLSDDGLGMKCGGIVEVYYEPVTPPARLAIFGGGHVGRAIARLAPGAGFAVEVVDDRSEHLDPSAYLPGVRLVTTDASFQEGFEPLTSEDFAVVVTRDAAMDAAIAARHAATCAYVGVMGSQAKRAFMQRAAAEAGVPEQVFARVRCPMGVNIGADTPEEIAISLLAELIALRASRRLPSVGTGSSRPRPGGRKKALAGPAKKKKRKKRGAA